ncbi:hypothetical protein AMAG_16797 [Allomyces macrogynus ATCC 38327]|uniref:Uncharacterized protein n=1 Tax=Allomyces macrogynus (strain ATCC 38327) TaxID=578462 RepID=A0A0L0TC73_ALLM3|nr:hypothetical protein AMAG_16797 [Allomyces macrogynus ATCC 38327]|eukprot:KNE72310.1 hypothetical protein AMAG_16797 [Allomyces macrogynus ATCC 38327]
MGAAAAAAVAALAAYRTSPDPPPGIWDDSAWARYALHAAAMDRGTAWAAAFPLSRRAAMASEAALDSLSTTATTSLPSAEAPDAPGIDAMAGQFPTARRRASPKSTPAPRSTPDYTPYTLTEEDIHLGLSHSFGTVKPFVCQGCSRRWKARSGFLSHLDAGCPRPYAAKVARGFVHPALAGANRAPKRLRRAPSVQESDDQESDDQVPAATPLPVDNVVTAPALSAVVGDATKTEPPSPVTEQVPMDQYYDDYDDGVESDSEATEPELVRRHPAPPSPSFTSSPPPTSPQLLSAAWGQAPADAAAERASTPTSSPARTSLPFICVATLSPPRSPLSVFLDDKENIPPVPWTPPAPLPPVLLPSAHMTVLDQSGLPSPRFEEPLEALRDAALVVSTERDEQDEDVEDHALVGQLFSGVGAFGFGDPLGSPPVAMLRRAAKRARTQQATPFEEPKRMRQHAPPTLPIPPRATTAVASPMWTPLPQTTSFTAAAQLSSPASSTPDLVDFDTLSSSSSWSDDTSGSGTPTTTSYSGTPIVGYLMLPAPTPTYPSPFLQAVARLSSGSPPVDPRLVSTRTGATAVEKMPCGFPVPTWAHATRFGPVASVGAGYAVASAAGPLQGPQDTSASWDETFDGLVSLE